MSKSPTHTDTNTQNPDSHDQHSTMFPFQAFHPHSSKNNPSITLSTQSQRLSICQMNFLPSECRSPSHFSSFLSASSLSLSLLRFISHMSLWNDEKDTVENSLSSRSLQLQQSLKAKQSCLWRFSPSFNLCLPFFRKRRVVQTSYVMWWYTAAISGLYSDQKMKDTVLRSYWRWEGVYMYLLCHVICFYPYLTIHSLIYTYYTVEDHFF